VDDGSEQPVVLPSKTARVIRQGRHRGRSAAINVGLKAASHDLVLIMWDDIYAAPDMVVRLVDEFARRKDPRSGLRPRVVWDPDLPLTLTMRWVEDVNKFVSPVLLSKSSLLEQGGYDENFTRRLEDVELQVRLSGHGFKFHTADTAVGFQNNVLKVRDLIEREFMDGVSAVLLHSKFPHCMPPVDDMEGLNRNESQSADAQAVVDEIALLEQSGSTSLPEGASELYVHVCRHYFLRGIFEGLKDMGGIRPVLNRAGTVAIYRHASYLESVGELDEARRLFRLVLNRPDEGHWNGAEYHLGCIESSFGNDPAARIHFMECLRLNPAHSKARRELNRPMHYTEVDTNVYELDAPATTTRILFAVFGDLTHVVQAFPVIAALRERLRAETIWLTSPEFVSVARLSVADSIHQSEPRGILPWNWIHSQGFTHVFFPEPAANQDDWEQSGLHAIDFMAAKCGVGLKSHIAGLVPNKDAQLEAEEFLEEHGLSKGGFVTVSCSADRNRHWPKSNVLKLAQQLSVPTIVFGKKGDAPIPGTVLCLDKSLPVIAALIRWSSCYLGGDSGVSWLATTTNTPMAVFYDPASQTQPQSGFQDVLRNDKTEIKEWNLYTSVPVVLEFLESTLVSSTLR
jgi:hypothetical protein